MWNISDRIRLITISLCLLLSVGVVFAHPALVAADTLNITSSSDWEAGTLVNANTTAKEGTVQLRPDGSWGANGALPTCRST